MESSKNWYVEASLFKVSTLLTTRIQGLLLFLIASANNLSVLVISSLPSTTRSIKSASFLAISDWRSEENTSDWS